MSDTMKTIDEILNAYRWATQSVDEDLVLQQYPDKVGQAHQNNIEEARQALSTMIEEIIGSTEVKYSNLDGNAGYWEKHGRNELRATQRERAADRGFTIDKEQV